MQGPRERRLKELDGWRAISVLLVIFHHLGLYQAAWLIAPHHRLNALTYPVLQEFGRLGVRIFFVISGFVICRLLILEEDRYGAVSLKGFYIRRVFRILPPLFVYLACLGLLLSTGWIHESWQAIGHGASFLYDFLPVQVGSWFVGHTWSLAVEEQFYLTFPTIWVLAPKGARKFVLIGALCALALCDLLAALLGWNHLTDPSTRAGFVCIACGVGMACFEAQARAFARRLPPLPAAIIALSLLWHPRNILTWESALYDSIYMPLAIALLLLCSMETDSGLRRFVRLKPVQAVGLTSYGIYLWQQLFLGPPKLYLSLGRSIPYLIPLLFVIIPVSYFLVEKPAMRFGRTLAARVRPTPTAESAIAMT